MGDGAAYAYLAMKQAIADAGLERERDLQRAHRPDRRLRRPDHRRHRRGRRSRAKEKGPKRVGPFLVPRACRAPSRPISRPPSRSRASTTRSARPARPRRTASATPSRCIQLGKQDSMFAGGGEELDWTLSVLFDAMGAMSSKYNDTPTRPPRLRQGPRRLRDLRRRRHAGARGARASPARAAPRSTPRSSATAPPPTAPTWWPRRAKARCAA